MNFIENECLDIFSDDSDRSNDSIFEERVLPRTFVSTMIQDKKASQNTTTPVLDCDCSSKKSSNSTDLLIANRSRTAGIIAGRI